MHQLSINIDEEKMLQLVFICFQSCLVQSHPCSLLFQTSHQSCPLSCEKQHLKINHWPEFFLPPFYLPVNISTFQPNIGDRRKHLLRRKKTANMYQLLLYQGPISIFCSYFPKVLLVVSLISLVLKRVKIALQMTYNGLEVQGPSGPRLLAGGPSGLLLRPSRPSGAQAGTLGPLKVRPAIFDHF